MKLNNTRRNNMINNNNVDYYPLYQNDGILGTLCNSEGCLVKDNDTDNIKCTIINPHLAMVRIPDIMT